jgi:type I restriction-modification system DNA methylase subunit
VFSSSGGFDVIIGNPPYVRSINLKENDPILWNIYRSSYKSASEREWDIYLIFVEKGVTLLNTTGRLGFILPNKFVNSQVGKNLRLILSLGRWLREIVHFGALQVFEGVTTYTCLLFLGHEFSDSTIKISRYIGQIGNSNIAYSLPDKSSNLWNTYNISETSLNEIPWVFTAGSNELMEKLKKWPILKSIVQIYKGTGTNADKVFLLDDLGTSENLVRIYSFETNKEYLLEHALLKKAYYEVEI